MGTVPVRYQYDTILYPHMHTVLVQMDLRRPKHEVQTCFSIAVSTNKLYGTPRNPASTVTYAGAWAVFERLTKQVVNKRDEMVVDAPIPKPVPARRPRREVLFTPRRPIIPGAICLDIQNLASTPRNVLNFH